MTDYNQIIADSTETLRLNPKDAKAYYNRGIACCSKKDYERAIVDFTEALRFLPNNANAYFNRGLAYLNKKDYGRSVTDFTEALRLEPDDARFYSNRGIACYSKRDYDKAAADFERAVELDPGNARFRKNLAKAKEAAAREAEEKATHDPGAAGNEDDNDQALPCKSAPSGGENPARTEADYAETPRVTENTKHYHEAALGGGNKRKLDQMLKGPFFTFAKPYFDFIAEGKLFSLVYFVMAGISLLLPFAVIFMAINSNLFRSNIFGYGYMKDKFITASIFTWLVIAFASWIGFQLWLDRRKKTANTASFEFIAAIIFSDILQTAGEWLGTLIGIIGAGSALIGSIILGEEAGFLFRMIGLGFVPFGPLLIIMGPVTGFFIILGFRLLAEALRLCASLVNNTREIAANLKNQQPRPKET